MSNKITEKFFTQDDFSQREKEVLNQVTKETGFQVDCEIFRGFIYDRDKVGSLIYRGKWQTKPAVLKLQGLRPEVDEEEIIRHFSAQNQSQLVRVPELYAHLPWNEKRGYGYLITEYIDAPKIFQIPFATPAEMQDFARFYQEYRTSALTRSWLKPETLDSLAFTIQRVNHWRKISESKKILKPKDYLPYLERFTDLAEKHLPTVKMVFCHGHLTANDVFKLADGRFVILSNLFWSYRPEWYDLAFNLWACIKDIRDLNYTFKDMLRYVGNWLAVYRQIPVVKKDGDFERKIAIALLERSIGVILVDLVASEFYQQKENAKYLWHIHGLHQKLFDHLASRLE
jgi:hypothetical protein